MTYKERKAVALIFNVLLKKLGRTSRDSYAGSLKVKPRKGETVRFKIRELSWSVIDIENETNSLVVYDERMRANADIVIKTKERPHTEIYIKKVSDNEVEGEVDGYRFLLEIKSYDQVEITDSERNKKFYYEIQY